MEKCSECQLCLLSTISATAGQCAHTHSKCGQTIIQKFGLYAFASFLAGALKGVCRENCSGLTNFLAGCKTIAKDQSGVTIFCAHLESAKRVLCLRGNFATFDLIRALR